ncbi:MAG: hypothetical protein JW902_04205 [Syntrophaceae bacterium]|nr:hypothetical protein [Syntrophaceae bacterium]
MSWSDPTTHLITREIQRERVRFERIQRYHGAVAVATDWSHALRLNREVIRLNK